MWSRACVGVTVLMAAAVHPAVGQSGTEFTIGGGVAASAGGQQFTDPVPFNEVAGGVTGAVRWPLSKSARLGLSVEWARFPFTGEDPSAGMTGEGAREFLAVAASSRWYIGINATPPHGFVGVGFGMAWERFTQSGLCAVDTQTFVPCDPSSDDTGAWWGGEVGLAIPVTTGLRIDISATLSGVVTSVAVASEGPQLTSATWVGLRAALGVEIP